MLALVLAEGPELQLFILALEGFGTAGGNDDLDNSGSV